MNANVSKLLNEQINKEFYSAYLYLDFVNYYASVGLDGFENWYRVQAQEERDHAMLFYQYLQNNGEGVTFEAIAKPEWERGDHMTPLKKALEHEKLVTASIDAIYAAAYEAKDFRAMQMLDLFIKEQGEEEKNAADLITKMELFGGGGAFAPHRGVGFAGPVRPDGAARSYDMQPVREDRGYPPARYAEPDRTGAGTGNPLI